MNLKDVKLYLRVDYEEDDILITQLMESADIYIDSCVGEDYKEVDKMVKLSELAKLKLIKDWYDNRSSFNESKYKKDIVISSILDKLSNFSCKE